MMKLTVYSLVALAVSSTAAVFAQPKIIATQQFSFGKVYKGTRPTQVLTIVNAGKDTLKITDVSAQCGCTAAMASKKVIAPADSGKLSISFNTASYDGPVTKHVYVSSNDPSVPRMTIEFSATVVQSISADPSYLSFNISKLDSTYSKIITLTNTSQQSVKIVSVDTQFDGLKVSLLKNQLMPGDQTELQTIFHPTKPDSYQGTITLKTDNASQPSVELRVFQWFKHP